MVRGKVPTEKRGVIRRVWAMTPEGGEGGGKTSVGEKIMRILEGAPGCAEKRWATAQHGAQGTIGEEGGKS